MSSQALVSAIFAAVLTQTAIPADAGQPSPRSGSYEITTRLELPHLERWAVDRTTTICLPGVRSDGEIPVPVLSANNPFAKCAAANFVMDGVSLQYDIICSGRDAAKAHATYTLAPGRFTGHIAMVMGAKNMTMIEVQHARRVGDCGTVGVESAARF